jgi:hypothetical protein
MLLFNLLTAKRPTHVHETQFCVVRHSWDPFYFGHTTSKPFFHVNTPKRLAPHLTADVGAPGSCAVSEEQEADAQPDDGERDECDADHDDGDPEKNCFNFATIKGWMLRFLKYLCRKNWRKNLRF